MTQSFKLLPFEQQSRVFTNTQITHNLSLLARLYSPQCTLSNEDLIELSDMLDDFTFKIYTYVTEKLDTKTNSETSKDDGCIKNDY